MFWAAERMHGRRDTIIHTLDEACISGGVQGDVEGRCPTSEKLEVFKKLEAGLR